jgi:cation transport ATPase
VQNFEINFMPKTPKTHPKPHSKDQRKTRPKKTQSKAQSKPVSLMKSKSYWITLTLTILVFTFAYGYVMQISVGKELLILGSIFLMIGFAFYIGFKPSASYNKRATFIFIGASIVGFSIWAVIVLSFNATGFESQISSSIGDDFFAITSLIICLVLGAFIGDLIGKNREAVVLFAHKFRN